MCRVDVGTNRTNAVARIDDASTVCATYILFGQMFLSMLACLERQNLLRPDSEVKSLGIVMALYIKLGGEARANDCLDGDDETKVGSFSYHPAQFDEYVLAYAEKHGIALKAPDGIDKLIEDLDKVDLPTATDGNKDPWGWKKALATYKKGRGPLGGDRLDITSWTSARRREHNFDKKDPLGKKEIANIKKGMILEMA